MRVLQSLGLKNGNPTPFYYRRDADGIHIKPILGKNKREHFIQHETWSDLLGLINRSDTETFAVSPSTNEAGPDKKLYRGIRILFKKKNEPVNDSIIAYICSILVNEGTLQLYSGRVGKDREARIVLRKAK